VGAITRRSRPRALQILEEREDAKVIKARREAKRLEQQHIAINSPKRVKMRW